MDGALPWLTDVFERFGGKSGFEIEARLKGVTRQSFDYIKEKLDTSPAVRGVFECGQRGARVRFCMSHPVPARSLPTQWTSVTETESVDLTFTDGTRVTRYADGVSESCTGTFQQLPHPHLHITFPPAPPQRVVRMEKSSVSCLDVPTPDGTGVMVRLAVAQEVIIPLEGPAASAWKMQTPRIVRVKRRTTYRYKDRVLFELTRVQQGSDRAAADAAVEVCEVELEWCGRGVAAAEPARWTPQACAEDFLTKVKDLTDMQQRFLATAGTHGTAGSTSGSGGGGGGGGPILAFPTVAAGAPPSSAPAAASGTAAGGAGAAAVVRASLGGGGGGSGGGGGRATPPVVVAWQSGAGGGRATPPPPAVWSGATFAPAAAAVGISAAAMPSAAVYTTSWAATVASNGGPALRSSSSGSSTTATATVTTTSRSSGGGVVAVASPTVLDTTGAGDAPDTGSR